jgi:hypothetical protein
VATIEVGLTPSGLGDLFRDFDEIFSDYITLIAERDDGHSGSPQESCMAACCQRAGDIPPMSCDQPYLAERDAEGGGRILVGSGSAAVSHRELTTVLTTTKTTVRLPDARASTTMELISCLVVPSACTCGSEGWGFESLRARTAQRPFPSYRKVLLAEHLFAAPAAVVVIAQVGALRRRRAVTSADRYCGGRCLTTPRSCR